MRYRSLVLATILAVMFSLVLPLVADATAPPGFPALCYGQLIINGEPAPVGTEVVAKIDGEIRGSLEVEDPGWYGGLGLESKLAVDGTDGDLVRFYVNGTVDGVAFEDVFAHEKEWWGAGEVERIDLSVTVGVDVAYTLTVEVSGEGTVTPWVGTHTYPEGYEVSLVASPAEGWEFSHWDGDVSDPDAAETSVVLDENKTVAAHFVEAVPEPDPDDPEEDPEDPELPPVTPEEHSITVEVDGDGSVTPEVGVHTYEGGTEVTLTAEPASGMILSEWLIDGEPTGVDVPTLTITVEVDVTITAVFVEEPAVEPQQMSGVVDPDTGGTVEIEGVVAVTVPPGATERSVAVTVIVRDADDPEVACINGERMSVGNLIYEIRATDTEDDQAIRRFAQPLMVTFTYSPEDVDDPEGLLVHVYCEDLQRWVPLATTVDPATNQVIVQLDHLTKFAVFEVDRLTDLADHWSEADVLRLTALGAISGYPDQTFRPDQLVTREQFARMLVDTAGLEVSVVARRLPLLIEDADAVSDWAQPYVEAAVVAGLIEGFGDGTFRPLQNVTRVEVAVMLARALELTPVGTPLFADADEVPDWGAGHVAALSELGIVRGYLVDGEYYFQPQVVATRAEAAAFLTRYLEERLRR